MTAEEIVRKLAEHPPPTASNGDRKIAYCLHCLSHCVGAGNPVPHADDCPWRMAQEWVAQNPPGGHAKPPPTPPAGHGRIVPIG